MQNYWLAHVGGITGLNYVSIKKIVMTSSVDFSVRLWTLQGNVMNKTRKLIPLGTYIGCFGQLDQWILDDPITYAAFPTELEVLYEKYGKTHKNQTNAAKHANDLLLYWRSKLIYTSDFLHIIVERSKANKKVKNRLKEGRKDPNPEIVLARLVIEKWRDYVLDKKLERIGDPDKDVVAFKSTTVQRYTLYVKLRSLLESLLVRDEK